MCRVCRRRLPKGQLERWVIRDGQLAADPTKRLPGRGYYSDSPECAARLPKALKLKEVGEISKG